MTVYIIEERALTSKPNEWAHESPRGHAAAFSMKQFFKGQKTAREERAGYVAFCWNEKRRDPAESYTAWREGTQTVSGSQTA